MQRYSLQQMLLLPLKDYLYYKCRRSGPNPRRRASRRSPAEFPAATLVRLGQRDGGYGGAAPDGPDPQQPGLGERPDQGVHPVQSQVGPRAANPRYVWTRHGLRAGFYRGLVSSVFMNCFYRGLNIGFYDTYKNVNQGHSAPRKALYYWAFVMCNSLVLHPLDTVRRTYMNENNYRTTKVGGRAADWPGLMPDQLVRAGHGDYSRRARAARGVQGVFGRVAAWLLVFAGAGLQRPDQAADG